MLDHIPDWLIAANETPASVTPFMGTGNRNTSLAAMAGFLVRRFGLTGEALASKLHALNDDAPDPLPGSEVESIVRSFEKHFKLANTDLADIPLSRKVSSLMQPHFRHAAGDGWYAYDGKRWVADPGGLKVREAAKRWMELILDAMKSVAGNARANNTCLTKRNKLNSLVALIETDEQLVCSPTAFNADPNLLNLQNGTLELDTRTFREHRADDLLTQIAAVDYDPDAACPAFDGFLQDTLPDDVGQFILRLIGYSLLGNPTEHKFAIWHGHGRNGKTTLASAVSSILGDYAANAEPSTFIKVKSERIRTDLARLRSKRFVTTSELARGEVLDAALVKRLTGGDTITSRGLYKEETEMTFQALVVMTTNALPVIDGSDMALARRLFLVPFNRTVAVNDVDPELPEKLRAEGSGILNRFLAGLAEFRKLGGLQPPAAIVAAAEEYVRGSDLIQVFLDEFTETVVDGRIRASKLQWEYRIDMAEKGLKPLSAPQFKAALEAKGYHTVRTKTGTEWVGLVLKQRTSLV